MLDFHDGLLRLSPISGSIGSRKGKRWKSVSRVQIRRMPCSRINTAVSVS